MSAGFTVAIAHCGGLPADGELHSTAETTSFVLTHGCAPQGRLNLMIQAVYSTESVVTGSI